MPRKACDEQEARLITAPSSLFPATANRPAQNESQAWGVGGLFLMSEVFRIHVLPCFSGEPEHEDSIDCWCEPELDYRDELNGGEVWVHRRPH